jgi:hypothetical protein
LVLTGHAVARVALRDEASRGDDTDHATRTGGGGGDQLVGDEGLDLGLPVRVVPGDAGEELLPGRDLAVATVQDARFAALALGADHPPGDGGGSGILGRLVAASGGPSLVKLNQALGRGVPLVLGQGGGLPTAAGSDDEPVRGSRTSPQGSKEFTKYQLFLPL